MTALNAAPEPAHRLRTVRFGAVWIAACSCGSYMGLARASAAAAMEQGTEEHLGEATEGNRK